MSKPLKQSTATTIVLGPFLDDTDGKTPETGLSIAAADVKISKNGGAFAAINDSLAGSHMEDGLYSISIDATDTGTLGRVKLKCNKSGALPWWTDFEVLPANVFDSLYGSDKLQVDAVEISGDATAADNLEASADGTGYNLGGGSVVATSVTGAVGSVTGSVGGNVAGSVASVTGNVGGNVNGSVGSVLGGINTTGGTITTLDALDTAQDTQHGNTQGLVTTVDTVADAIKAKTDNLPSSPAAVGSAMALTSAYDNYMANIEMTNDEANSQDEYNITWYKNGAPVTSGITTPLIQVVKRSDGTDLVSSTAMTQVGSTATYKYDEGTNRLTAGEAGLVVATATIDGSARTFKKWVSRDSTGA